MVVLLSGSDGHVILIVHHVIGFCGDVYLVKLLLKTIYNEFFQYERNHGIYLGNPKTILDGEVPSKTMILPLTFQQRFFPLPI